MRKREVEEIADKALDWCATNFGKSRWCDTLPIVEVEYDGGKHVRGEFDGENCMITLYSKSNTSPKIVIMTVLHEFKHYLQSPVWLERYSKQYSGKLNRNPYEIEAEMFAEENWEKCRDFIMENTSGKYNK